jgi:hypothetical protein
VAGFFVAALMVLSIGDAPVLLWLVFPVACFFAAYSPGAIHFVVGQAAFTVMVVTLFSLIDAPGFATAVVRVETVSLGAVTAAVLSLVLWPRGGRTALGHAVAGVYRAAAAGARTFVTGTEQARRAAEADLAVAWRQAEAAFSALLAEHDEAIDTTAWAAVLQPPMLVRSLLSGLVLPVPDLANGCQTAVEISRCGRRSSTSSVSGSIFWCRYPMRPAFQSGPSCCRSASVGTALPCWSAAKSENWSRSSRLSAVPRSWA